MNKTLKIMLIVLGAIVLLLAIYIYMNLTLGNRSGNELWMGTGCGGSIICF